MTAQTSPAGRLGKFVTALCAFGAFAATAPAFAEGSAIFTDPGVHVAMGRDPSHGINKYEVGINWNTPLMYGNPDGWLVRLQVELEVAGWDARSGTNPQNLFEFGATPIVRFQRGGTAIIPFFELGVGPRLLTHTSTSKEHNFSSAFQFSDMAGFGVAFGQRHSTEVGFRFQHISNAGIREPNPGSNFYTGYVRYRF
jgi:lipid A 3-O-deacylase